MGRCASSLRAVNWTGRITAPLGFAISALVFGAVAWMGARESGASGLSQDEFAGPETCRSCHQAEYESWARSPHARATNSLPENARRDPRCLRCHATSVEQNLLGVSCEACHGAGKYYWPSYVMRDRELSRLVGLRDQSPETCKTCHTADAPSLEPFDYDKAWRQIAHGKKSQAPAGK
ncbi:MAG: hypothetical protein GMKNLPBB_02376 [Myxococcota bacterium]|nr:hypothetical protein [Myxococcota bacterium]